MTRDLSPDAPPQAARTQATGVRFVWAQTKANVAKAQSLRRSPFVACRNELQTSNPFNGAKSLATS